MITNESASGTFKPETFGEVDDGGGFAVGLKPEPTNMYIVVQKKFRKLS